MRRAMVLRLVLGLVAAFFLVMAWGVVSFVRTEPALAMMMCVYVTLGVFLAMAIRNPAAHRSLIGFTAWSSVAHATLMVVQAELHMIARGELIGVGAFYAIGVVLLVLMPRKTVDSPAAVRV